MDSTISKSGLASKSTIPLLDVIVSATLVTRFWVSWFTGAKSWLTHAAILYSFKDVLLGFSKSIFKPAPSISSGPPITKTPVSRSWALLPKGPITVKSDWAKTFGAACPLGGKRPHVGLWPKTPQKCAGFLIDPPISEPVSKPVIPEANAAADPPDDPPGLLVKSQGLFVVP